MPSYLKRPVLPMSPSPSPLAPSSSEQRKGKKSSGLLRHLKRGVLILVGQEDRFSSSSSLRKRKEKNERFPPKINVPPPSSSHASIQSQNTPHFLPTPSSTQSSRGRQSSRKTRRDTVLSVLGISLDVSSPVNSSSVRSSLNGSPLPSPVPSSCASRPISVGSASTRTSPTKLPRGRRNSHQYKWQSENKQRGEGDRLQLPWLSSADENALSMASFMAAVAQAAESADSSPEISVRRECPIVERTTPLSPVDDNKEVQRLESVPSRKTKSPIIRRRPAPLLQIPDADMKCSNDIFRCSLGSSMHSTEVADVLSAALKSIKTSH